MHELLLLNDKKIYLLFRFALGLLKSLNFKPMSFFTFIGLAPGSKILLLMLFSDLSYSDDRLTNLSYDWDMSYNSFFSFIGLNLAPSSNPPPPVLLFTPFIILNIFSSNWNSSNNHPKPQALPLFQNLDIYCLYNANAAVNRRKKY